MLGVLARRLPGGQTVTSQETLMTPAPSPDVTVSDSGPSYVRRLGVVKSQDIPHKLFSSLVVKSSWLEDWIKVKSIHIISNLDAKT